MAKTKRIRAGVYHYHENGRTFQIEEVRACERMGKPQWNVSEHVGGYPGAAFDAADTKADAIYWASVAANTPPARTVNVRVEKLPELYLGKATGSVIFHTMERGCTSGLFRGCPLGRGYSEAASLADFTRRANADDAALKLPGSDDN
jgi:hypothetical protein